jgi:hypothetical protein
VPEFITVPITFRAADGSSVHSPLLAASVDGVDTLLVLDTGADVHLLTMELAGQLGLELSPGESGLDHAGNEIVSWEAADVGVHAGSAQFHLRSTVVIPAPQAFLDRGIGGSLSPQQLLPDGWVALDLARDELLLAPGHDGAAATLAARSPHLETLRLPRDGENGTLVVSAAVKPFPPVATLVDTGGRHTEVEAAVVPGLTLGPEVRLGAGVGGADVMGWFAGPQVLALGGGELVVPNLAVRTALGLTRALIGMDVLRGTVVICNGDPSGEVLLQVPA